MLEKPDMKHLADKWEIALSDFDNETDSKAILLEHIAKKVSYWLDKDYQKLLWALYALDVPEKKFEAILKTTPLPDMANQIAALILEREMDKAEKRAQSEL